MTICSKEGQISDCYFGKVTSAMRPHEKLEFKYFLSNAQGSVSELATELLIAQRLGYVKEETFDTGNKELTSIERMILGLSRSLSCDS